MRSMLMTAQAFLKTKIGNSLFFVCLLIFWSCAPKPIPSSEDNTQIDLFLDPEMEMMEIPETVTFSRNGFDFTITLKASYRVRGVVVSKHNYGGGWNSIISPCDIALVWGDLLEDELHKKIRWSQSDRWYYWHHGEDFPHDNSFIARYSSNNHIVPATPNLGSAANSLKRGDRVELVGYLVNVDARKQDNNFWWRSSMSVDDTGDGSCELIYVTGLKTSGKVYE